jgi:hypothetical protein
MLAFTIMIVVVAKGRSKKHCWAELSSSWALSLVMLFWAWIENEMLPKSSSSTTTKADVMARTYYQNKTMDAATAMPL